MKRAILAGLIMVAVLVWTGIAAAELSVTIVSVSPTDGRIGEGERAVISWKINADSESGDWRFEIGGDGTWETGDTAFSSDASGTFTGTTQGSSTILSTDLDDGDGDYTVYFIARDSSDSTVTDSTSTTITLDNPPSQVTGVTAGNGNGKAFLNWDDHPDSDLDYFLVYYGYSSGSTASDYTGANASEGPSPVDADDATSFSLNGLENEVRIYIRVSAVDDGGMEGPLSEEVGTTPRKSAGVTEISGEEDGCFIATAAFGSFNHPQVKRFRQFRDRVLLGNGLGQGLVKAYYKHSPPAARWLTAHPGAKAVVRVGLIPLAWYAQASLVWPLAAAMIPLLLLAAFAGSFSYAVIFVRRRSK